MSLIGESFKVITPPSYGAQSYEHTWVNALDTLEPSGDWNIVSVGEAHLA